MGTDGDEGPTLLIHFRMTGRLAWGQSRSEDPEDAVVLVFDHGELAYREQRRLGAMVYVPPGVDVSAVTGPLGPDATEFDRARLGALLEDRRGGLKATLMNQERIAGLGNELVDEILSRSGLHPRTRPDELSDDEVTRLHRQLRRVLRGSIRAGHIPSGPRWLNSQRRAEQPRCPRCNRRLARATVAGRTTV